MNQTCHSWHILPQFLKCGRKEEFMNLQSKIQLQHFPIFILLFLSPCTHCCLTNIHPLHKPLPLTSSLVSNVMVSLTIFDLLIGVYLLAISWVLEESIVELVTTETGRGVLCSFSVKSNSPCNDLSTG